MFIIRLSGISEFGALGVNDGYQFVPGLHHLVRSVAPGQAKIMLMIFHTFLQHLILSQSSLLLSHRPVGIHWTCVGFAALSLERGGLSHDCMQ
jgi:hypothetical protein